MVGNPLRKRVSVPLVLLAIISDLAALSPFTSSSAASGIAGRTSGVSTALAAPASTTNALTTTVYSASLHGGYVAAGVGMRDRGFGHVTLQGIPLASRVTAAYVLWDVLDNVGSPEDAIGAVNSSLIHRTLVGTGGSPCWPTTSNFAYDANVTSLITGNGTYALSGFASGLVNGVDPWTESAPPPFMEGASLIVIYTNASLPVRRILVVAGAAETPGAQLTTTLTGITAGASSQASTTFIVGDGQSPPDAPATFDGVSLSPGTFSGQDPQDGPPFTFGDLGDTETYQVGSYIHPGDTSAIATIAGGGNDCVVWVGQALEFNSSGSGTIVSTPDVKVAAWIMQFEEWGVSAGDCATALETQDGISSANALAACSLLQITANPDPPYSFKNCSFLGIPCWVVFEASQEYRGYVHLPALTLFCHGSKPLALDGQMLTTSDTTAAPLTVPGFEQSYGYTPQRPLDSGYDSADVYTVPATFNTFSPMVIDHRNGTVLVSYFQASRISNTDRFLAYENTGFDPPFIWTVVQERIACSGQWSVFVVGSEFPTQQLYINDTAVNEAVQGYLPQFIADGTKGVYNAPGQGNLALDPTCNVLAILKSPSAPIANGPPGGCFSDILYGPSGGPSGGYY